MMAHALPRSSLLHITSKVFIPIAPFWVQRHPSEDSSSTGIIVSLIHCLWRAQRPFVNGHPAYAGRALPGPQNFEQIPALAERGKSRLMDGLVMINAELADRPFIAGQQLSFADIDLLAVMTFAKWAAKTEPTEAMSDLNAWRQRATEALHDNT